MIIKPDPSYLNAPTSLSQLFVPGLKPKYHLPIEYQFDAPETHGYLCKTPPMASPKFCFSFSILRSDHLSKERRRKSTTKAQPEKHQGIETDRSQNRFPWPSVIHGKVTTLECGPRKFFASISEAEKPLRCSPNAKLVWDMRDKAAFNLQEKSRSVRETGDSEAHEHTCTGDL